jgi:hypothetical protein
MRTIRSQTRSLLFCILICATTVHAQVLPQPEPPFRGKIGRTVKDSTPDFPKEVEAPREPQYVYPLDSSFAERADPAIRPSLTRGCQEFTPLSRNDSHPRRIRAGL